MSYIALLLWLGLSPAAQVLDSRDPSVVSGQCELWGLDRNRGEPLIFGRDYVVPELRFRLYRDGTEDPIFLSDIIVIYKWMSLAYDADRYNRPIWAEYGESLTCLVDGSVHEVVMPPRVVRPVGWYDGAYTRFPLTLLGGGTPRFSGLEVVLRFGDCSPRLIIDERELRRYRGMVAVVTTGCRARPTTVEFKPVVDADR